MPQVSKLECIASCATPISKAWILTWILDKFPKVEPPTLSDLFAKNCTGTCAFLQISKNTALLKASVVYFWFAASFITIPLLINVLFVWS